MKVKNKIGFKKAIITSLIIIVATNIICGILMFYQYKLYTNNFNKKICNIVTIIKNEYPDIDKNELIEVLNNEQIENDLLFKEYGIDLSKDSLILENDKCFANFLIQNLIFITFMLFTIFGVFLKYNKSKDKKLAEITRYIEEINNKNYKLDIDDNTEDELSILKNEIYKTTVMLKEVAENSASDKANLKDSLSDISHQLKTPLTSITIMLDNILDTKDMDENTRNDFIKDIKREIININFLVNTLLKLSKLDANSVKFINNKEDIR